MAHGGGGDIARIILCVAEAFSLICHVIGAISAGIWSLLHTEQQTKTKQGTPSEQVLEEQAKVKRKPKRIYYQHPPEIQAEQKRPIPPPVRTVTAQGLTYCETQTTTNGVVYGEGILTVYRTQCGQEILVSSDGRAWSRNGTIRLV
jgi:hypothetical protein